MNFNMFLPGLEDVQVTKFKYSFLVRMWSAFLNTLLKNEIR